MAGIYIHIPFCKQACTYCNFHFSTSFKGKTDFLLALCNEIRLTNDFIPSSEIIETIYLGGGTPSLLSTGEIELIFNELHKRFHISSQAEITIEANPDNINNLSLKSWAMSGINRLSVGIQSFNDLELKWMNRAHNSAQSLQCLNEIEEEGFKNYSVDLIYGSPLQSNTDLEKNIEIIAERAIPHISAYALTVEPKTFLFRSIKQGNSPGIDGDKQAEQFQLLLKLVEIKGYEAYEISNFAKPGFRSRHNSGYWQGKPYYGFGAAAHSFDGKLRRRWNIANNALYIQSLINNIVPFEEEILTSTQRLNEYIMTSLRTIEGVNINKIKNDFGELQFETILKNSKKFIDHSNLRLIGSHLQLTDQGKFLADGIASDLFF